MAESMLTSDPTRSKLLRTDPMDQKPDIQRPSFDEAFAAWKQVLQERGMPTECFWAFDENLCFEADPDVAHNFRLGIQTRFTPTPPDAERMAYDYFTEFEQPLVFYRIGNLHGKSVCLLLCDEWFEKKTKEHGFVWRQDWSIAFRPGENREIPEVAEQSRWENRLIRDRPLHDLDFCMTLRAVHEVLAHGRVLSSYEHYALRFLHLWKRVLRHSE
jgi:hypothetical protein